MPQIARQWHAIVLESPAVRTTLSVIIPIFAGVLSGTFVAEITINGSLEWGAFWKAKSFYALAALSTLMYLYNRALYFYERDIRRFLDADFCTAYMRSKCLPEAAERYKELIRAGTGGELKAAMDELRKILK